MIKYLKHEELDDVLTDDVTIVDFYADWCGPCKMLGLQLEELVKEKDIDIIKVNVDERSDLARKYGVMSIPVIAFYKNKELVKTEIGFVSKEKIKKIIEDI